MTCNFSESIAAVMFAVRKLQQPLAVLPVVIIGLGFSASPLLASSELPIYPVEQWCNRVAGSTGQRSELIYSGCLSQEQSAYDNLKPMWSSLSSQMQKWCDTVAKSGGSGSYLILNGCIDQEQGAARENSSRQFRH
jgi:hypothetical protein